MRTLVLNASMEPINIIPIERAVRLALTQKVIVISEYDRFLHSNGGTKVRVPSVVALKKYIPIPRRTANVVTRRGVFMRDNNECQYCGKPAENLDHIVPRAKGGKHEWTNVVASCIKCNSMKADKHLKDTNLKLRRQPTVPKPQQFFGKVTEEDWLPYIKGY